MQVPAVQKSQVIIAVIGATGTGKSTFIKHVTGDDSIVIGHDGNSETFDVQTYSYVDPDSGASVLLVDTPGFDDSRDGVTDTDILEKIAAFLEDNGGRKLNGIIYMHRISDVRVGGVSRKILRMFKELCGDDKLHNVRIVTTCWDRVSIEEGNKREAALAGLAGVFPNLLAAGAQMCRQDSGKISARKIMSELIANPVLMKITELVMERRRREADERSAKKREREKREFEAREEWKRRAEARATEGIRSGAYEAGLKRVFEAHEAGRKRQAEERVAGRKRSGAREAVLKKLFETHEADRKRQAEEREREKRELEARKREKRQEEERILQETKMKEFEKMLKEEREISAQRV